MTQAQQDLAFWQGKCRQAKSPQQVFQLLDGFRKLKWTDEESAGMAKVYMRTLDSMGYGKGEQTAPVEAEVNDGPVWYEKM
jgi:hypothetical protein